MTANRIIEIALDHFAENGYEGASLAHIAEQVGIKTPSIYAHFKSKDDLFLRVIEQTIHDELKLLREFCERNRDNTVQHQLFELIAQYKDRYDNDNSVKFLMRMMFFPPVSLQALVMEHINAYLDKMEQMLVTVFERGMERAEVVQLDVGTVTASFMCLLDGVLVEMLLGGPVRFKKRLDASWKIYWLSLTP
ncbi:TetR/AcrR family transcriptional regulator [Paenibacillus sp. MER TA 81-3]|uniref:TetR/AcrR family transcriptional regulator n=1 Tax=Paenibacillus sp. MER TA 81-3 TaxID=2939573 RepID=UPI0020413154|nr:TetR/AcrR family transcriptional regulator [Paenibacillus sp. MER TA 81-3]MCM3337456.1 TetR/AcrR family transcriptional regulator [Paenibacillus sp. MER TA 81-3]